MQKKVVVLVDDRDGSVAKQTISFAFKGVSYEIDLSDQNAEAKSVRVRRWAREKGIELSDRGRIPSAIIEQFEKENR